MAKSLFWVGAGDLAQRTLPYLNQKTDKTIALKRHGQASGFDQTIHADVTQATDLTALPTASHLVYSATPSGRSPESYAAVYKTGLENLLKNIDKNSLTRFVFISSTAVYGANDQIQNEQSQLNPSAFNGKALVKAEEFLRAELGDKLVVIRFTGLYGPGRNYLFNQLRQGHIAVNPAPDNYANRIHIDDAARVCAHVLELEQAQIEGCYLGTDSTPLSINTLYRHAAKYLGAPAPSTDENMAYESRHFSNQRLLQSGFEFLYPDTLQGYKTLIENP